MTTLNIINTTKKQIMIFSKSTRILFAIAMILSLNISNGYGQEDPVLFTIGGEPTHSSEFEYIYQKNNSSEADYSKESISEYLNLFINFKLKVKKARAEGMDTIPTLKKELATYRDQLAKTYLSDKSVMSSLLQQAYGRLKEEVRAEHILFKLPKKISPADTAFIYNRAYGVYDKLKKGELDWAVAVKQHSQDKNTKSNGGDLGYISAVLPRGYYQVENALYELVPGEMSSIIRSPRGYHIFKIVDRRVAKPELELAHIYLPKGSTAAEQNIAKNKMIGIKDQLNDDVPFEQVARSSSKDMETARRGGYIGYVKPGTYEATFEEACYALDNGSISEIIESTSGYHIVHRIGTREDHGFKADKRRIEKMISKTERVDNAKKSFLENIERSSGFKFHRPAFQKYIYGIDSTVFTPHWKGTVNSYNPIIMTFNDETEIFAKDFERYLKKNPHKLARNRRNDAASAVMKVIPSFKEEQLMTYEKRHLETKYPEFKSILREYDEGILLFEITKKEVWDKGSMDTVGLKQFFKSNRDNYKWADRAKIEKYRARNLPDDLMKEIHKLAKTMDYDGIAEKNRNLGSKLTFKRETVEKTKEAAKNFTWKEGSITDIVHHKDKMYHEFIKVKEIMPATQKELNECKGFVIADYQDVLEEKWVESLKMEYPIEINKASLKKLIKK